ncbi:MAG: beta-galactosidase [Anaerolineae bacterium]|nr:beta-galactosidase [Anaerolineae bacterium]
MKFFAGLTILFSVLSLQVSAAQAQAAHLVTRWAADVTPYDVLPEYPRPQLVREQWLNLNGLWDYAITAKEAAQPSSYDGQILVPFPIESYLSGVQKRVDFKRVWYHRSFSIQDDWAGQRLMLNFGAVDWDATVYVNGKEVGTHQGGYDVFSFDITDALKPTGDQIQDLVVSVWDPTEGTQPHGKQVLSPGSIWYTPTTGIWQTVWIEPVDPTAHIDSLRISTDIDAGVVKVALLLSDHATIQMTMQADVMDGDKVVASLSHRVGEPPEIAVPDAKLWSPDSPFLYNLRVTLQDGNQTLDTVNSYFGMRKIEMKQDNQGIPQIYLNNLPIFQFGLLDQGFWPDGLYTAPTDEALRSDIETTKSLGFNLIRKHVKVEPARWYYWADKLGMLVWQDMPSMDDVLVGQGDGEIKRDADSAANFEHELQQMIDTHSNSPSIIMWVLFNEGWGQYDTARLTQQFKHYDPTRLVDSASGWNDFKVGDVQDVHTYPGPDAFQIDYTRANLIGEFGGLGLPLEGHTWLAKDSWGYKQYTDVPSLLADYTKMIKRLRSFQKERHLVAAIYTQTTDVETEVNGIMTYDREVIKMGADNIKAVNATLFAP